MRTEFGQHFKWILAGLALIFIIGAIWSFGGAPSGRNPLSRKSDDVVATVNGQNITRSEMEVAWEQRVALLKNQGLQSTLDYANAKAMVFQQLVQSRLMLDFAQQKGVDISNREVNAERDKAIGDYLRQQRRMVLGKISTEEEKLDPRQDPDFKDELAKNGMSLSQLINNAETFVPESDVKVRVAEIGLQNMLKRKVGNVSDADVTNSYNVYKLWQIVVFKNGMPADQLKTRVDKIETEAKKGVDFSSLVDKYSIDKSTKSKPVDYSYGMLAPQVWDIVTKMKQGDISSPIDTDQAVYIVKLDGVTPKLPAKFDNKAKDQRRQMIEQMKMMSAAADLDKQIREKMDVKVIDPELAGYWYMAQAQQAQMSNPAEYKKQIDRAASEFKKAISKEPNNDYATAELAMILKDQGKNKEASHLLYQLLDGPNSKGGGSNLRITLGDLMLAQGKTDEALQQYAKASDSAVSQPEVHQMLQAKYTQMKRPDLAAKEKAWLDDYNVKKQQWDARNKQGSTATTTVPVKPAAPKPGG